MKNVRIKEVVKESGKRRFYIQYKVLWLFWVDEIGAIDGYPSYDAAVAAARDQYTTKTQYREIEE